MNQPKPNPHIPDKMWKGQTVRQRLLNVEHMTPENILFRVKMEVKKYVGATNRSIDIDDLNWLIQQAEKSLDSKRKA